MLATDDSLATSSHPVCRCANAIDDALDRVQPFLDMGFATAEDKRSAMTGLYKASERLRGMMLAVMATAREGNDVCAENAFRDVPDLVAHATKQDRPDATRDWRLAQDLYGAWQRTCSALTAGEINTAQARVIVRALNDLPDDLEANIIDACEEQMLVLAETFSPKELIQAGRRILEYVAPDVAEEAEAKALDREDEQAARRISFTTRKLGDGTTKVIARVTDQQAARLTAYLDAFTSPRHERLTGDGSLAAGAIESWSVRRGRAFGSLLEHLDPSKLPQHGGDAATIMITIPLDKLRKELSAADLLDTGDRISATQTRRLACNANLIPAVLGGDGQVLDLGRSARLFSPAQRKALRLRDTQCRADGCTIPAPWCEAHHKDPWSEGGATDLSNGVLLCSFHHHRAHDPRYQSSRMPNGDVRFSRRT